MVGERGAGEDEERGPWTAAEKVQLYGADVFRSSDDIERASERNHSRLRRTSFRAGEWYVLEHHHEPVVGTGRRPRPRLGALMAPMVATLASAQAAGPVTSGQATAERPRLEALPTIHARSAEPRE